MHPRRVNAAGLIFALLVLATVAAFAYSERLKRDPLVVDHVTFATTPGRARGLGGRCRVARVRISFRITLSVHAIVQVVDPSGGLVRTLASDRYLPRYNFFTFYWDGREGDGRSAAPGPYKLRVELLGQERNLILPGTIRLPPPRNLGATGCRPPAKGAP